MKTTAWTLILLLISSCSGQREESRRGETQNARVSANAEAKPSPTQTTEAPAREEKIGNQAVVQIDKQLLLSFANEADITALGPTFSSEFVAPQQIAPGKTLFYAKNNVSYVYNETGTGELQKLTSPFIFAADTQVFVMEQDRFWLLDSKGLAFPATASSGTAGQVTIFTVVPELLKNPDVKPRILFAGPKNFILSHQNKANIVVLEGDKAKVMSFEYPKANGVTPEVLFGGIGSDDSIFWFATGDRLLVLKRNEKGEYSWLVSPFKIENPAVDPATMQLTMILALQGERDIVSLGRPLLAVEGKIYATEALKLTFPDPRAPAITADFTLNAKPVLTNFCVPCHAGYDDEATVRLKSAAFKDRLINKTMPPTTPLSDVDSKKILDWYATIPL